MYIENINSPADLKNLDISQLETLAAEMREALIKRGSIYGGHFGPNMGIVEATIALHYVFDSPKDKIVFDVSHQCYPHKMLTGRKDAFICEEHYADVSGYTNPEESEHDAFIVGHTSTSVSLACGLSKARDTRGESHNVVAVIGDGSLSGGEALEGLDYASELGSNLIIVVNDNDMSIAENHGGLYANLKLLRDTKGQAECNLFKAMNLDYMYVDEGNSISALIDTFERVKGSARPVVVHIRTVKGKGYAPAEQNKEQWHYHAPFDIATGKSLNSASGATYADITSDYLLNKMKNDPTVVAITAGTPTAFGFNADKRIQAGRQFTDVGIAEETAVALAAGIAVGGGRPVFGVHSTFIQRAYDQICQDVCLNSAPVTFLVFSGSVYGMNHVTHTGFQDVVMLSNIPGMVYLAPTNVEEYKAMLDFALSQRQYPVAIRIPGGAPVFTGSAVTRDFSKLNKFQTTRDGSSIALIGAGTFYKTVVEASAIISERTGVRPTVINPYYLSGVDTELLDSLKSNHSVVATLEDGYSEGGFGSKISAYYAASDMKVINFGLDKKYIDRYRAEDVLVNNHLTPELVAEDVLKLI